MNFKIIPTLFLCLLLIYSVSAIGVTPASREVILSDSAITYSVRIINEEKSAKTISLEVTGELANLVSLNKNQIFFQENQAHEDVLVTINAPININPGEYVSRLVVSDTVKGAGQNLALVGVSSRIIMVVPGEGANLETNIFAPNFVNEQTNTFSVEVTNKGNADAKNCVALLTVYSSLNTEIASLISEKTNIQPKSKERIQIRWTPNIHSGNYLAKTKIQCENTESLAEKTFTIGSPTIKVSNIYAEDFKLGSLVKLNMIANSDWGENINDVFAEVVFDDKGKTLSTYTTASKDFKPRDAVVYDVFLDTRNILPGVYKLFVNFKYLNKETETVFEAKLTEKEIILTSITGQVIGGATSVQGDEQFNLVGILVLAIIVIVILNIFFIRWLMKRKANK